MPTCQPPVVALLGSGSCLRLVPLSCPSAPLPTCPGTPCMPHPFQDMGLARIFSKNFGGGLLDIAHLVWIGGFNIGVTRYPSQ